MAKHKDTTKKTVQQKEVINEIFKVTEGEIEFFLVGTSGFYCNRLSEKVRRQLILPPGRKNEIEKATTLKHNPVEEFRASPYTMPDGPTYCAHLSTAFKGALRDAALDMPGAKKAQIGRLAYVRGEYVPIYGLPKLAMDPVRSADMNRTPDIRTRAILPTWACRLVVTFSQPLIRAQAIANLLAAAGMTIGVGDWRPQKGAGSYGRFRIADKDDPEFKQIVKEGGREAQIKAFEHPVCYNAQTAELMSWFDTELAARKLKGVA